MTMEQERVPYDTASNNGLIFFEDKYIPEDLLTELFLHYFDSKTLLSCQSVCKCWYSVIQNYVWRKRAEVVLHHALPDDENVPWTMYYLICEKKIFHRNFIKNHSGQKGIKPGWVRQQVRFNSTGWRVESPPRGIPQLPADPIFQNINHCFVTTYYSSWKEQVIDLIKEGFTEWILDNIQPVILVSEYYGARFDCSGIYKNEIKLFNDSNEIITRKEFSKIIKGEKQNQWFKFELEIKNYGKGLRKIVFGNGGKDGRGWRGYYGIKLAGACIYFRLPVSGLEKIPLVQYDSCSISKDNDGYESSDSFYEPGDTNRNDNVSADERE